MAKAERRRFCVAELVIDKKDLFEKYICIPEDWVERKILRVTDTNTKEKEVTLIKYPPPEELRTNDCIRRSSNAQDNWESVMVYIRYTTSNYYDAELFRHQLIHKHANAPNFPKSDYQLSSTHNTPNSQQLQKRTNNLTPTIDIGESYSVSKSESSLNSKLSLKPSVILHDLKSTGSITAPNPHKHQVSTDEDLLKLPTTSVQPFSKQELYKALKSNAPSKTFKRKNNKQACSIPSNHTNPSIKIKEIKSLVGINRSKEKINDEFTYTDRNAQGRTCNRDHRKEYNAILNSKFKNFFKHMRNVFDELLLSKEFIDDLDDSIEHNPQKSFENQEFEVVEDGNSKLNAESHANQSQNRKEYDVEESMDKDTTLRKDTHETEDLEEPLPKRRPARNTEYINYVSLERETIKKYAPEQFYQEQVGYGEIEESDEEWKDDTERTRRRKGNISVKHTLGMFPSGYKENDSRWTLIYRDINQEPDLINILPNRPIYVKKAAFYKVKSISKNSKELARNMLGEIFTFEALGVCSFSGRGSIQRPGLDQEALDVLLQYVKHHSRKEKWEFDYKAVTKSLTNKLTECKRKFIITLTEPETST